MSDQADGGRSGEFVQSLERGLAVILAFGAERTHLTLSEVARETGLSRAAARRFLLTLVELGYIGTDDREFYLRPRLLELGYTYLAALGLPEIVRPHLQRLSDGSGESSSVAVLDAPDIVYVARVARYRILSAAIGVGTRLPAFATSMGRAILAYADEETRAHVLATSDLTPLTSHTLTDPALLEEEFARVRARGWSIVDQELDEGLRSIAAPIRDASGRVTASVNLAAPVRRGDIAEIERTLVPLLLDTAAAIEQDLHRTGLNVR